MALSEAQKKKIEEEEAFRAEVREGTKPKKNNKGCGCLLAIAILVIIFIAIVSTSGSSKTTSSTSSPTPSLSFSDEYKTSLADSFCKNRSDGRKYFDLEPVAKSFSGEGSEDKLIYNVTKKPSSDVCKKVVEGCLKIWKKQECEDIANKKIWIGMSELQLDISWGNPNDKNNTTGAWGIHTQRVYGDPIYGATYVYLEGTDESSMKVTSWQD